MKLVTAKRRDDSSIQYMLAAIKVTVAEKGEMKTGGRRWGWVGSEGGGGGKQGCGRGWGKAGLWKGVGKRWMGRLEVGASQRNTAHKLKHLWQRDG